MYTLHATHTYTSCSTRRSKAEGAQDHAIVLPVTHGPPGQNFYAYNRLFNILLLGEWMCHVGGGKRLDKDRR